MKDFDSLPIEMQGLIDRARVELTTAKGKGKIKAGRESVIMICGHFAEQYVESARKADERAPEEAPWLETVLACNAASNPTVRKIIEAIARELYEENT